MGQKIVAREFQVTVENQQGLICHSARFCYLAEDTLALCSVEALGGSLRARLTRTAFMAQLLEDAGCLSPQPGRSASLRQPEWIPCSDGQSAEVTWRQGFNMWLRKQLLTLVQPNQLLKT